MKNMNMKIRRVPYSRLTKSGMADYVENTINIVHKQDCSLVAFNPLFELLLNTSSDVELLRLSYGVDGKRLKANKLKEELNLLISALKLKVRMASKSKSKLEMHPVKNAINQHLRYLDKCRNDNEYSQRIAGFFDLIKNDADVSGALDELDLIPELTSMKMAYYELKSVWSNRIQTLSERPYCNTKLITQNMTEALNRLFDGIEASYIVSTLNNTEEGEEGEKFDFASLIDELNQLTTMVRRSINLRDLINKRRRNGEPVDDLINGEIETFSFIETPPEEQNKDEKEEITPVIFEN